MSNTLKIDLRTRLNNSEFLIAYGENIAKADLALSITHARKSARLTQQELAKKLGKSQSYIAKLESGDGNPTIGNVGKILAHMGFRLVTQISDVASSIDEKAKVTSCDYVYKNVEHEANTEWENIGTWILVNYDVERSNFPDIKKAFLQTKSLEQNDVIWQADSSDQKCLSWAGD